MTRINGFTTSVIRSLRYRPLSVADGGFRLLALLLAICLSAGVRAGRAYGQEKIDIVFLVDGSNSMHCGTPFDPADRPFVLQKMAIKNSFFGDDKFIPADGTAAISVVEFWTNITTEIPLTIIDDSATIPGSATASTLAVAIDEIGCENGGTGLVAGLARAIEWLELAPA